MWMTRWKTLYNIWLSLPAGGGKPKMKYHFNNNGWPATAKMGGGAVPATDADKAGPARCYSPRRSPGMPVMALMNIVHISINGMPVICQL